MDNLKCPAYPIQEDDFKRYSEQTGSWTGFTKLELGALMIAQGIVSGFDHTKSGALVFASVAATAVQLAKAVLEEANK